MKRVALMIGVCMATVQSPAWAAALTQAEQAAAAQKAFSDAQALAGEASASAAAGISGDTAAKTVNSFNSTYYRYSDTAPEAALFQGGNGSTQAPALNKITSCANDPANPDKFLQQNCDAINLMAKNPSTRPQFQLTNDPMFAKTRAIEANSSTLAANALGFVDQNAIGAFTGCTTQNQTTPATQAIEVCHEGSTDSSQTCRIGRSVVVSANTNYQCDKTTNTYLPQTCGKTLNVTVTQSNPIPATAVNQTSIAPLWRYKTNSECQDGGSATRSSCRNTRIYWCPPALPAYSPSGTWGGVNNGPSPVQCTVPITAGQCPDGYTLSGDSCVSTVTASTSYSCPAGYTLNGSTCSIQATQTATTNDYCPAGYTLNGSTCSNSVPANTSYSCPATYTLSGSTCSKTVTTNTTSTYSCPAGYTSDGTLCTRIETVPRLSRKRTASECQDGGSTTRSSCRKRAAYFCPIATPAYSPSGVWYFNTVPLCTRTLTTSGAREDTCPPGYTQNGTTCSTTANTGATSLYQCPTGYVLSGSNCQISFTASRSYTCPSGYTLSGTTCSTVSNSNATALYQCPTGYSLSSNGSLCTRSVAATFSYICPANTTPFGTGVNTMCGQPPVITSTIDNGCAAQEAAAL